MATRNISLKPAASKAVAASASKGVPKAGPKTLPKAGSEPAPKTGAKAAPAVKKAKPAVVSSGRSSPVKQSAPKVASAPKTSGAQSKAANRPVTKTTPKDKAPAPVPKPAQAPKAKAAPADAALPRVETDAAPEQPVAQAKPKPPAASPAAPEPAAPKAAMEAPPMAGPRPTFIVAAPPNMPIRSNNPNSPRPPMGRPNMPPSFAVRGPGRPGFAEAQAAAPRPPAAKIELKAGDHVVYPTHGVGTVQGIETIEAAGAALQMIVVTFEENRMTLRVPVNKVPTAGLRKLFTPEEFEAAIDTLKGRARIKRTMWSRRAQEYEAKINSGDPIQIAEVVRDLQRNAGQPDQSFSERQIYEQALERLAAEYAAIEKIDKLTASDRLVAFAKSN
jgi:CarD family transcriptional regulator